MQFRPVLWLSVCLLVWALSGLATATQVPAPAPTQAPGEDAAALKAEILTLARSFSGQGDPDFSKQKQLDALVDQLLQAAPQPPTRDRLHLLPGRWRQVWGPYDYRTEGSRDVDPQLDTGNILQVVFPQGHYYTITLLRRPDKPVRVGLLRGEFRPAPATDGMPHLLRLRLTNYPGNKGIPTQYSLWQLPGLAERDALPNGTTIIPGFLLRLFAPSVASREVYIDDDLRISYGSDGKDFGQEVLYVMERVE